VAKGTIADHRSGQECPRSVLAVWTANGKGASENIARQPLIDGTGVPSLREMEVFSGGRKTSVLQKSLGQEAGVFPHLPETVARRLHPKSYYLEDDHGGERSESELITPS
jgi:hypothetical protein